MRVILFVIFFVLNFSTIAQQLFSGIVSDEKNTPIPFAKLFVKNAEDLRTLADVNGYFEMRLMPGEYYVIITSGGYDKLEFYLAMDDFPKVQKFNLSPTKIQEIIDMEVSAKKSNPGRDIMLEVVKRREQINQWNYPHKVEIYTRATEKIIREEKTEKEKEKEEKKKKKKKKGCFKISSGYVGAGY